MAERGGYPVPATSWEAPHESRLEIRRSRFLAQCFRARSPEEAKQGILGIRARYPQATHNCWAYLAGPPGDTARIGSSDDGEPRGTAGRPILNALLHGGVGEAAIVVTRWFGGTKLGTGGLSRAYQESARNNLENLPTEIYMPGRLARVVLDYAHLEGARKIFCRHGASLEAENYGERVEIILNLPLECLPELQNDLAGLSGGQALFEPFD